MKATEKYFCKHFFSILFDEIVNCYQTSTGCIMLDVIINDSGNPIFVSFVVVWYNLFDDHYLLVKNYLSNLFVSPFEFQYLVFTFSILVLTNCMRKGK